jgi:hypothetical protein
VLRTDVGGEERTADREEADIASGEEVVLRVVLSQRGPPGDETDDAEVGSDDYPIERDERLHGGQGVMSGEVLPETVHLNNELITRISQRSFAAV